MVPHDHRVRLQVIQKLDSRFFRVSVYGGLEDLHTVHLVHGPDVVEEIRRSKPGVSFRDVVGSAQNVPEARIGATGEPREATKKGLDGRDDPEIGLLLHSKYNHSISGS